MVIKNGPWSLRRNSGATGTPLGTALALMRAVRKHPDCPWVLRQIERWLKAPMQMADGSVIARERGTRQGRVISPPPGQSLSPRCVRHVGGAGLSRHPIRALFRCYRGNGCAKSAPALSPIMRCKTNFRALGAFRPHPVVLWQRMPPTAQLQEGGLAWWRITRLTAGWLRQPRILHPGLTHRPFAAKHTRSGSRMPELGSSGSASLPRSIRFGPAS